MMQVTIDFDFVWAWVQVNWWIGIVLWYLIALVWVRWSVTSSNTLGGELETTRMMVWISSPILVLFGVLLGTLWRIVRVVFGDWSRKGK